MDLSVIVPVYNEKESISRLGEELTQTLSHLNLAYEVIFVDDGSRDGSNGVIKELAEKDSHFRSITLRKNFGKARALASGFKEAHGEIISTIDADLQFDPKELPKFLDKLKEGYDLVNGYSIKGHNPFPKRLSSKIVNWTLAFLSRIKLHDLNCGFKVFRREVLEDISLSPGMHRYIPLFVHAAGYKVTEVKVGLRPRRFGSSKYGLKKFYHGFFDILSVLFLLYFRKKPLYLFGGIGVTFILTGLAICLHLTISWFNAGRQGISDRPLLFLGVLLIIVGTQFISTGLLGEMIVSHREIKS